LERLQVAYRKLLPVRCASADIVVQFRTGDPEKIEAGLKPMLRQNLSSWLYVSPLMLVLVPFFLMPIIVVLAASFLDTDGFGGLLPSFTLANYLDVLTSAQTFHLYMATLKFTC